MKTRALVTKLLKYNIQRVHRSIGPEISLFGFTLVEKRGVI